MGIVAEFSNSTNRTERTLREQRGQRWQAGFDAYVKGASLADLHDDDEKRGYWAANKAAALAENPAYANQRGW